MAKIRTISRKFFKGHPKESQPTFFIEKFLNSRKIDYKSDSYLQMLLGLNTHNIGMGKLSFGDVESLWLSLQPIEWTKHHTVRAGQHFKQGDSISIRCWFGKPYKSPQIILTPDVQIKMVFDFKILHNLIYIDGESFSTTDKKIKDLAINDGLEYKDFLDWFGFPKEFKGQVICWRDINY